MTHYGYTLRGIVLPLILNIGNTCIYIRDARLLQMCHAATGT